MRILITMVFIIIEIFTIQAQISPKPSIPDKQLLMQFPVRQGDILMHSKFVNFGLVKNDSVVSKTIRFYNFSDKPISIFSDSIQAPSFIKISFDSDIVEPKESSLIKVSIDGKVQDSFGFFEHQIRILTNDSTQPLKDLFIVGTVVEAFPKLSEDQIALAPRLVFDVAISDFKSVNQGDVLSTVFKMTNAGTEVLNIRGLKSNCGCVTWSLGDDTLSSGDSTSLVVYFDTKGRRGNQFKSLTVFSNDPTAPNQMLTLKAQVITD